jgi:hypothetical protein
LRFVDLRAALRAGRFFFFDAFFFFLAMERVGKEIRKELAKV